MVLDGIQEISFRSLTRLNLCLMFNYLAANMITSIDPFAFANFPQLKELYLRTFELMPRRKRDLFSLAFIQSQGQETNIIENWI